VLHSHIGDLNVSIFDDIHAIADPKVSPCFFGFGYLVCRELWKVMNFHSYEPKQRGTFTPRHKLSLFTWQADGILAL